MLDELAEHGLRPPLLAADTGYGDNSQFRSALDGRSIDYIVQVKGDALAHEADVQPVARVWSGHGRRPMRTDPRYPKTAVPPRTCSSPNCAWTLIRELQKAPRDLDRRLPHLPPTRETPTRQQTPQNLTKHY
ncbi:transposase [Micromonospora ureilytica]|uniref:transposase n=1 Tax=Micromonospora ureilytica TaxID=709868 RepID=UPI001F0BEF7C|nr:transposase [Micromonospora ureilytica]